MLKFTTSDARSSSALDPLLPIASIAEGLDSSAQVEQIPMLYAAISFRFGPSAITFCLDAKSNKKVKAAEKPLKFIHLRCIEKAKARHDPLMSHWSSEHFTTYDHFHCRRVDE